MIPGNMSAAIFFLKKNGRFLIFAFSSCPVKHTSFVTKEKAPSTRHFPIETMLSTKINQWHSRVAGAIRHQLITEATTKYRSDSKETAYSFRPKLINHFCIYPIYVYIHFIRFQINTPVERDVFAVWSYACIGIPLVRINLIAHIDGRSP